MNGWNSYYGRAHEMCQLPATQIVRYRGSTSRFPTPAGRLNPGLQLQGGAARAYFFSTSFNSLRRKLLSKLRNSRIMAAWPEPTSTTTLSSVGATVFWMIEYI